MSGFRYAQLCPLARATEILGERWTLLVLRELFCGPQRFADLRRRLEGVSASVLSARLARLEERGLITRRQLPPPAASTVYELAEAGRALEPALVELMRWGVRWLEPVPGDHAEPDWLALAARLFARSGATPALRVRLEVVGTDPAVQPEVVLGVEGGAEGTRIHRDPPSDWADTRVRGPMPALLGLLSGLAREADLRETGAVAVEGPTEPLALLPGLFDLPTGSAGLA